MLLRSINFESYLLFYPPHVKPLFEGLHMWRRGWDSNPRNPQRFNGFQDRLLKPLGHPSELYFERYLTNIAKFLRIVKGKKA